MNASHTVRQNRMILMNEVYVLSSEETFFFLKGNNFSFSKKLKLHTPRFVILSKYKAPHIFNWFRKKEK